ncbi:hypothetical protein DDQ41_00790 [Streptomyces spongiicola]|uniref:Uncharacterized protein n=1 Tax=Streptomyces spongiicola TaxID=1690221 RepID=A0ABN5KA50_9ACTN|nr:hypothetical protein [Streptomyces spongiicola]AWK07694.1 hypothetical protein DDQ41_00790 [Streptomyces spongiicola]
MDLIGALPRLAARRPPVLLVTMPGATRERLAVEAELTGRGWPSAPGPAAAAGLVVAGRAGGAQWLGDLWNGMPRPRAYVAVAHAGDAPHALDLLGRLLSSGREGDAPRAVSAGAPRGAPGQGGGDGPDHHPGAPGSGARETPGDEDGRSGRGGQEGRDGRGQARGQGRGQGQGRKQGRALGLGLGQGRGQGQGQGQGHGGHRGGVAGLPMAGRADDRDGLRLDRLHLPLGPALADWPAGLVLDVALQGDVLQSAEAHPWEAAPAGRYPFWGEPWLRAAGGEAVTRGAAERRRCASHLDSVGRFLAVSGWPRPAARARRLRDRLLQGAAAGELAPEVLRLTRGVARSRTLRWLTRGLGELPAGRARELGVTGPALAADGDVHARLRVWLGEIERSVHGMDDPRALTGVDGPRGRLDGPRPPSRLLLAALLPLLPGAEFACARLILASFDPDPDEFAGAGHG